jgi:hypothetical protein
MSIEAYIYAFGGCYICMYVDAGYRRRKSLNLWYLLCLIRDNLEF